MKTLVIVSASVLGIGAATIGLGYATVMSENKKSPESKKYWDSYSASEKFLTAVIAIPPVKKFVLSLITDYAKKQA